MVSDSLPVHDPEHAFRQMGCGPEKGRELLTKLVRLALQDVPAKMTKLLGAMEQGDLAEAGAIAHNLKSSVSHLGAPAMFEALRATETACREGRREEAEEQVGWIYAHWPLLESELRAAYREDPGA